MHHSGKIQVKKVLHQVSKNVFKLKISFSEVPLKTRISYKIWKAGSPISSQCSHFIPPENNLILFSKLISRSLWRGTREYISLKTKECSYPQTVVEKHFAFVIQGVEPIHITLINTWQVMINIEFPVKYLKFCFFHGWYLNLVRWLKEKRKYPNDLKSETSGHTTHAKTKSLIQ